MGATLIHGRLLSLVPTNFCKYYKKELLKNNFFSGRSSPYKCCGVTKQSTSETHEGFSVLKTDIQGDIGSIWSSIGFYVFSIHVPLSFGGLPAAANIFQQPLQYPQIEAFFLLGLQTLELSIVLLLLKYPGKPQYDLLDFFRSNKSSSKRNLLLASALGFGFLLSLVFITSYFADRIIGPKFIMWPYIFLERQLWRFQHLCSATLWELMPPLSYDVNNPFLKELLSSGSTSAAASILAYCIVTPFLEEVVYRGFLLTSLASKMKWQQAVTISSLVFSAAHFSVENFLQLLIVGFVLGCSYCWTGNLGSSIAIHSLYNAVLLFSACVS